ncbi:NupC/NupG family nucleoside CNT transporter [Pseudomonas stutzeri]|jgi:concentrative nucleoside transporter, CNT family|uniref:NupC/NupG family nucleoside CNT transporter n=2 Tax=Stutzerimonas TaxID=2901164 RepID=UPI000BA99E72|nr:NupC/NupG family nucleoside CNT transporter [Stutzerimonas stutzeri]MBA4689712.1 NupC/NupG family nucleoside CNT transporter [Pseudomonas sp.]MCF0014984.1 NupC/NupG family nucleoside CNT transporter [Stutzerimonas stutzeri]MCF0020393.1 NupC/NupG family nucleoside CNT transporter [Stutzerimonas stutzeri]MDH0102110.1 NupC/NupG family nucleoside CNT transporter [Stutzerimonas stutzeri]MDH0182144.1 NupC/NupG family nucleoside CNT transporter [Stutzerimonas stutzeri]
MSLVGIFVLLLIALAFSSNRSAIRLRTVVGAFLLQAGIGAFVLYVPWGIEMLTSVSGSVVSLQGYANEGISFLFGALSSDKMFEVFGNQGFVFAIRVLPLIVFFSAFIAVLYHLGVMTLVIRVIGGALRWVLGTSRTESMSATANIFVGQTEAPLVVRPFIPRMTRSELFAVMVGGLASVAGSVLIGYASLGVELKYLIAASFMAAPGGLLMAKLMEPETAKPQDNPGDIDSLVDDKPINVLDAAASGATSGLQLALNVGAMLLVFIALIAVLNGLLGWFGGWFGYGDISLQLILGYLFAPLAFVIGVPWGESVLAGSFIGQKLVLNEFVAYIDFVRYLDPATCTTLSPQTQVIVTFALCGFANLSSVGILIGGLGVMAPSRRHDLAQLGLKAVLAGSLSNLMSAALAGLFVSI